MKKKPGEFQNEVFHFSTFDISLQILSELYTQRVRAKTRLRTGETGLLPVQPQYDMLTTTVDPTWPRRRKPMAKGGNRGHELPAPMALGCVLLASPGLPRNKAGAAISQGASGGNVVTITLKVWLTLEGSSTFACSKSIFLRISASIILDYWDGIGPAPLNIHTPRTDFATAEPGNQRGCP